jgi:hypothetical protein
VFEYLRNQITDARPFFAESNTPFRRNQFGGGFGGLIKKNKLFFFGNLWFSQTQIWLIQ